MADALLIDVGDDVVTLLDDAVAGDQALGVTLTEDIARGHKVARHAITAASTRPGRVSGVPTPP